MAAVPVASGSSKAEGKSISFDACGLGLLLDEAGALSGFLVCGRIGATWSGMFQNSQAVATRGSLGEERGEFSALLRPFWLVFSIL